MPRAVFSCVRNGLLGKSVVRRRTDATSKVNICALIFLVAALCLRLCGKSYNKMDELCSMSCTSARESFVCFVSEVPAVFDVEYLRKPNEKDYRQILGTNGQRGFSCCVGGWCSKSIVASNAIIIMRYSLVYRYN